MDARKPRPARGQRFSCDGSRARSANPAAYVTTRESGRPRSPTTERSARERSRIAGLANGSARSTLLFFRYSSTRGFVAAYGGDVPFSLERENIEIFSRKARCICLAAATSASRLKSFSQLRLRKPVPAKTVFSTAQPSKKRCVTLRVFYNLSITQQRNLFRPQRSRKKSGLHRRVAFCRRSIAE